ncbi:MAG: hypothetical protein DMF90_28605 [Acidobacteria bacterium]|nr:MAG: hypothetical protein DMF90_28605 [Acidobacteriota bacterium]
MWNDVAGGQTAERIADAMEDAAAVLASLSVDVHLSADQARVATQPRALWNDLALLWRLGTCELSLNADGRFCRGVVVSG